MSIRDKSRRRLLAVLTVLLIVGGLAVSVAAVRLWYLRRSAIHGRSAGLVAIEQEDYPKALSELGRYLSRYPEDADILLLYAKARRNVQEPNGQNFGQAISLYQRVLELRPGLAEARTNLLDLYLEVGFNTETVTLANAVLSDVKDISPDTHAQITQALRNQVVALMRMQQLDKAQATMRRLTVADPLNLEFRVLELQIMLKKSTPQQVAQYASKLAQDHPNDSRFVLLKSVAASLAGDNKTAADLARPLATQPQVDAGYTRLLIRQLDNVELFDQSFSVIQQFAKNNPDRFAQRLWINRLFETNQFPLVIQETSSLDPASKSTDVELLAMRVLALVKTGRRSDAVALVTALENRGQTDSLAGKWATALRTVGEQESPDPVKVIGVLRDALSASPGNPILQQQLGDAYANAGSRDKAMSQWQDVARAAPEWSTPLLRISQSLIAAGRPVDALAVANKAQFRAPHDHDTQVAVVVAATANLPAGHSPDADRLLVTIADIQKQFPNDQNLVALQVSVLAREQRNDVAIQAIRTALQSSPPLSEPVLLSLAQTSQAYGLNLEDECFSVCQETHGLTPDLALARAYWLRDHQRAPEGLALMQKAVDAHSANDVAWRTAWADYLDRTKDTRAKGEWVALGEAHPDNVKIQWGAVSAGSVQTDHDFVGRTIDRLVNLLGDDSLSLRLLRARWYLHGNSSENDASQAAILLGEVSRSAPDMLAPRLLLASCYMKLGNVTGAINELAAASDAQPGLAPLSIEVARLLHSHGDFSRSRQYIDRAMQNKQASLQVIRQAASLLALQGDYPAALSLLENAYHNEKELPADLILAALYRQLNQPDKTSEICSKLLKTPDAPSVAFVADFYASTGRMDDAKKALAQLDGLDMPRVRKDSIRANYASRYATFDEALKDFQAVAQDAPQDPNAWLQLVNFCFANGKIDEALASAGLASHALAGDTGFKVILQNTDLLKQASNAVGVRPLLMSLGEDSAVNAALLEAIRTLVVAQNQKEPAARTALTMRQLADRNPKVLALQTTTLELYIESGQIDEAVRMATRTVEAFPSAVEPLRVEAGVLESAHRWDEALWAAKEWRKRDPSESLDADLAIAGADLQLGDVPAANQQIEPYLDRAVKDPDRFSGVLLLRARGLLAIHRPDQVESLLGPLLPKSQRLRSLWLSLAVTGVDDSRRAGAWLDQVAPAIPDKSVEKVTFANAWIAIGHRWQNPGYTQTGKQLLSDLEQAQDASIPAILSWGEYCESCADWPGAQKAYERVLLLEPANPVALNNLAAVLVTSGGDLDKAHQLTDKALSLYPQQPAFLDTRAMVQAAQKNFDGAISSLREAQRLDPQTLEWRVNMLGIMTDSGQMRAAKAEKQQIDASLATFPNPPANVLRKYDQICAKLQ